MTTSRAETQVPSPVRSRLRLWILGFLLLGAAAALVSYLGGRDDADGAAGMSRSGFRRGRPDQAVPVRLVTAERRDIDVHLRALGTPADGRAAARAGRHADLERIYVGQLELPEAIAEGAQMVALADEKPSALLCYEREPEHCHRTLLIAAVAPEAEVVHLFA